MSAESNGFAWCEAMLPKVSRTFAINIAELRGDLHRSIVLAYLWCRIFDTVEDAESFAVEAKIATLREFQSLFGQDPLDPERLQKLIGKLDGLDGDPDEVELVRNAGRVAGSYNRLPDAYRQAIRPSLVAMAHGMAEFQELDRS